MRNDVKLGFAIGGVLLAVVVVFALVNSSKPADVPTEVAAGQTEGQTDASTVVDTGRVTPPAVTTVTPTPDASTDAFARTTTPAPGGATDPWQDALTTGRVPAPVPPPLMSSTTTSTVTSATPAPAPTPALARTPAPAPEAPVPATSNAPAAIGGGVTERTAPARVSLPAGRIQDDADRIIAAAASETRTAATPSQPTRTTLAPTAASARTHTIKNGETFSTIATAYYGHIRYADLIAKANPGVSSNRLKIGQVINLPAVDLKPESTTARPAAVDTRTQYRVQPGESLYAISMKLYGTPRQVDALYAANKSTIGPDARKLKPDMLLQLPTPPSVAQK